MMSQLSAGWSTFLQAPAWTASAVAAAVVVAVVPGAALQVARLLLPRHCQSQWRSL